jgi:aminoglycoside phosphotransferase (APT) family kinase protein
MMFDNFHQFELLLESVMGTQTRIRSSHVIKQQEDYCVIQVRLRQPTIDVMVKIAGPKAHLASQFDRTVAIHRLVSSSTNIPLPEIIAADVTRQLWPWRYLIYASVPGIQWADICHHLNEDKLAGAYRQLGEAVGQLHRIEFPAFGEIDPQGLVMQPSLDFLSVLKRRALQQIKNYRNQQLILDVMDQHSHWFQNVKESRLCHEDLHGYNILLKQESGEWRLAAILDFDKAWAGHSEIDLARLEIWRGMTSPEFWSAYRSLQPLGEDYIQLRPIYQLVWCLEYASPSAQHLMDTQQVCRALGLSYNPEL